MKTLVLSLMMVVFVGVSAFAGTNDKTEKAAKPAESAPVNTTVSGVIMDQETGEALTGVEVKLNGTGTKTYTDFDGKFVFEKVKPGDYSVEANIISYEPVKRSIKVNTNEMHALNLKLGTVDKE